jgi:4a-hydroxytetrahydrobiopterin dehydratase
MSTLSNEKCEACQVGAPVVTSREMETLLPQIPDWRVTEESGVKRLIRTFKFKNFRDALTFTNKVGELAEAAGHHPAIQTEWGKVTVSWWTHKIKGLHRNDFIMAARTDGIAAG